MADQPLPQPRQPGDAGPADGLAADALTGGGFAGAEPSVALPGLRASLEAIILVADEPVSEILIAQVLERPRDEVSAALRELAASYTAEGRGFDLREIAGGWRYYTREDCAPVVERFVSDGQEIRLTQAGLETLSVIAYRQPVSRARVSAVRGVSCDGVMRTLVLRGLIEETGTDPDTGAILFGTTSYFLERLGLARLEDLPELAPFMPDDVDEGEDAGHEPART
jgi:segregation and condensation protein B